VHWLRRGTSGWFLWTRHWTFRFRKLWWMSSPAKGPSVFQGLCSINSLLGFHNKHRTTMQYLLHILVGRALAGTPHSTHIGSPWNSKNRKWAATFLLHCNKENS
jgi:hypothetical protein